MAAVEFGFSLGTFPLGMPEADEVYRLGDRVEELGYDSVGIGDHIVMTSPQLEVLMTLMAYAARTKRMKLITDILLVPLRNPAVTAKTVCTLDYLSKGRVILGVGVGGEHPKEWELCGIPLKERGARCDEALQIMRALWAEQPASHSGRFWHFDDVDMKPKPAQHNGPPIWIGGRSDRALLRAARHGDGWLAYLVTADRYRKSVEKIREFAAAEGRDTSSFTLAHHVFVFLDKSFELAREKAVRYLSTVYNQSFEGMADKFCALGTAEDCVRYLKRFTDLGVSHIILRATCPPDELDEQMRLYAEEILPAFR